MKNSIVFRLIGIFCILSGITITKLLPQAIASTKARDIYTIIQNGLKPETDLTFQETMDKTNNAMNQLKLTVFNTPELVQLESEIKTKQEQDFAKLTAHVQALLTKDLSNPAIVQDFTVSIVRLQKNPKYAELAQDYQEKFDANLEKTLQITVAKNLSEIEAKAIIYKKNVIKNAEKFTKHISQLVDEGANSQTLIKAYEDNIQQFSDKIKTDINVDPAFAIYYVSVDEYIDALSKSLKESITKLNDNNLQDYYDNQFRQQYEDIYYTIILPPQLTLITQALADTTTKFKTLYDAPSFTVKDANGEDQQVNFKTIITQNLIDENNTLMISATLKTFLTQDVLNLKNQLEMLAIKDNILLALLSDYRANELKTTIPRYEAALLPLANKFYAALDGLVTTTAKTFFEATYDQMKKGNQEQKENLKIIARCSFSIITFILRNIIAGFSLADEKNRIEVQQQKYQDILNEIEAA